MESIRIAAMLLSALLVASSAVRAQSVTGQISAAVVDPAGAVISGATAQLTNDLTKPPMLGQFKDFNKLPS